MRSDIASGVPLPPPSPPETSTRAVSAEEIAAMPLDVLQDHLAALLRQGMPGRDFTDRAEDGSPCVPSLVAVWLISQIGEVSGEARLVNLSKVNSKENLTSLAGVSRLVSEALDGLRSTRVAS